MLHSIQSLVGFTMGATDGEIGKVKDFYFDDNTWKVRYIVVETGNWLFGRKVLLSPVSLQNPDWDERAFPTNLTKDQIKNSPDIDTDKPVSRQLDVQLHAYYAWPYYGITGMNYSNAGDALAPGIAFEDKISEKDKIHDETHHIEERGDPHLRSFKEVSGYHVHATDGELGEVEDFLIDSTTWTIPFLVVETGNWYSGKKILTATNHIKNIEWDSSGVYVDQTKDSLKNSPDFDSDRPMDQEYERNLYNYYQIR